MTAVIRRAIDKWLAAGVWEAGRVVIYLALEPIVRRRWPDALVAWTRLLRGRIVDPLVGRDALIGVLGGVVLVLIGQSASGVLRPGFERWPASPALLAGGVPARSAGRSHGPRRGPPPRVAGAGDARVGANRPTTRSPSCPAPQ